MAIVPDPSAELEREAHPVVSQLDSSSQQTHIHVQGLQVGDRNRQWNFFWIRMSRGVQIAIISLVVTVLVVAGGVAVIRWVLPRFAPIYKTQFLIDAAVTDSTDDLAAVVKSLGQAVGNSGDGDALALRTFGGECGADDNTTRVVGFDTGNRKAIQNAATRFSPTGKPTLVRGIVQAVEDFSGAFAQHAKLVNRVIVITRHGVDACDDDQQFVVKEIEDRIAVAGMAIDFRLVGYQIPQDQRDQLTAIAEGVKAPGAAFVETPDDLKAALDWYTNVEPVLHDATAVIDVLNPAVEQVNAAVIAITEHRKDDAGRLLDKASTASTATVFDDLRGRTDTAAGHDMYAQARELQSQQAAVVAAARKLYVATKTAPVSDSQLSDFRRVASAYNEKVKAVNDTLAALRATRPGTH